MNPKTTPSNAVHKPITTVTGGRAGSKQRNEIFVDIIERLNVLFSPNGYVLNSNIDGCIQMKSYLSGQPELRLALNEVRIQAPDAAPARRRESESKSKIDRCLGPCRGKRRRRQLRRCRLG
eukprot:scaffold731_cov261-Pinguiococcus_pyrenoidosus.AAC.55